MLQRLTRSLSEREDVVSEKETINKINSRRYFEETWNKGKFEVLKDLLAETYVDHMPA